MVELIVISTMCSRLEMKPHIENYEWKMKPRKKSTKYWTDTGIISQFQMQIISVNDPISFSKHAYQWLHFLWVENIKDDFILNMTQGKQDKSSELSKYWSPNLTLRRNEVIMKT